jgi:hypothetical protein
MTRWITFDQNTACELRLQLPQEPVFEAPGRNALEYALSASGNVVVVLPAATKNVTAVATFRRRSAQSELSAKPLKIRVSGILGLSDEAVFEEEETPREKSWWRRIWED